MGALVHGWMGGWVHGWMGAWVDGCMGDMMTMCMHDWMGGRCSCLWDQAPPILLPLLLCLCYLRLFQGSSTY